MRLKLWESETSRLANSLFERVLNGHEKKAYREIVGHGFPEFFEAAVKQHAKKVIKTENPIRINLKDRFKRQNQEFDDRLSSLQEILATGTIFNKEELQPLAEYSIIFQFDVIVRPRQTLMDVLYSDSKPRKKTDVLVIAAGFGCERPFIAKTILALRNVEFDLIDQDKFDVISKAIEKQVYDEVPVSAFLRDVNLLMKLQKAAMGCRVNGLSPKTILGMLRERDLHEMAEGLKKETLSDEALWSPAKIENALQRYLLVGGVDNFNSENDHNFVSDKEEKKPRNTNNLAQESVLSEYKDDQKPRKIKIQFANEPRNNFRVQEYSFTGRPLFSEDEEFIINRKDIESQPPGPYPALYTLINPKTRKVFVRKIFQKNKRHYIEFIKKLEKLDRWKDAKAVIDEELRAREINPYSKEAVLLGDIVFSRYFQI
ncbi:MAG: hypothetical protein ACE5IR_02230 [bacterium]